MPLFAQRTFSRKEKTIIGALGIAIAFGVAAAAHFLESGSLEVLAWVVGVPLLLLSASLLFGQAAKTDKGIMLPFTLYLAGGIVIVFGIMFALDKSWSAFLQALFFGGGLIALGEVRRRDEPSDHA